MISELAAVAGPVLTPGDDGFADEVAAFNTAVRHRPDVVVGAVGEADVVEAVRYARARGYPVSIQATGHGAHAPVTSGMLVSTRRMDEVRVEVARRTATVGGGARWGQVFGACAGTGLFAVPGSGPTVGVVGYLLGGGLGPLARSHGFSSDYLDGLTVVSGTGEVLDVTADGDPDLLWALRGGKSGLGVVTSVRLRLVELSRLYAGALYFAEEDIEAALRAWVDWTASADVAVSSSVAIVRFPPMEAVAAPFRGRRLLTVRFAFVGAVVDGIRLAAPLRAAAPVYVDGLAELAVADFARIHNDPVEPGPSYARGVLLSHVNQDFATALLAQVGAGTDPAFVVAEVRQLGAAAATDVAGGSAVGGRSGAFSLGFVGVNPALFDTVLPAAGDRMMDAVRPWVAGAANINLMGVPGSAEQRDGAWSAAIRARLATVRRRVDPDGLFR